MNIIVDFPLPPEILFVSSHRALIKSKSILSSQLLDIFICFGLGLHNPYFSPSYRWADAKWLMTFRYSDIPLEITTSHNIVNLQFESLYVLGALNRVIVTEVRGGFFRGRYFHSQRVLAVLRRDLAQKSRDRDAS